MERNVLGRLQQKLEMVFVAWGLHSIQVLEVGISDRKYGLGIDGDQPGLYKYFNEY